MPIVSIDTGGKEANGRLFQALLEKGCFLPLITYPGGPENGAFRITLSSLHHEDEITQFLNELSTCLGKS